jgi:hypothetical protein
VYRYNSYIPELTHKSYQEGHIIYQVKNPKRIVNKFFRVLAWTLIVAALFNWF